MARTLLFCESLEEQTDSEEQDEREDDVISRPRPRIPFLSVGVAGGVHPHGSSSRGSAPERRKRRCGCGRAMRRAENSALVFSSVISLSFFLLL